MTLSDEKLEAYFTAMISGYATQAMVSLGKIANPVSGELERDIEQAGAMIDILTMIEAKTEGNRSESESSTLRQLLSTLRLNYVEEANKPEPEASGSEAESVDDEDEALADEGAEAEDSKENA